MRQSTLEGFTPYSLASLKKVHHWILLITKPRDTLATIVGVLFSTLLSHTLFYYLEHRRKVRCETPRRVLYYLPLLNS